MARRRIAVIVLGALLGAPMTAPTTTAYAAVIDDAVVNVDQRDGVIDKWKTVSIDIEWAIPDGSRADDTFSVTLPEIYQVPDGMTASFSDPAGVVLATGVTRGHALEITLTLRRRQPHGSQRPHDDVTADRLRPRATGPDLLRGVHVGFAPLHGLVHREPRRSHWRRPAGQLLVEPGSERPQRVRLPLRPQCTRTPNASTGSHTFTVGFNDPLTQRSWQGPLSCIPRTPM